eukprot:6195672-Pleurochrysis_carterae.AAC.2
MGARSHGVASGELAQRLHGRAASEARKVRILLTAARPLGRKWKLRTGAKWAATTGTWKKAVNGKRKERNESTAKD